VTAERAAIAELEAGVGRPLSAEEIAVSRSNGALFRPTGLEFLETTLATPRWAVEGIWPEHAFGIIAGRPKGGKSTIAAELAMSLWSGTPMFNLQEFPVRALPAAVLYIQQENADSRVQHDFQRIAEARGLGTLESEHVHLYDDVYEELVTFEFNPRVHEELPALRFLSQQGFDFSDAGQRNWLEEYVREMGVRYVFLDPLYMLVGATKITDGGDELRPYLTWLTGLSAATGAAPILTHHLSGKKGMPVGPESLLGATFIWGWYEAAIYSNRDDHDTFTFKIDALRGHGVTETHTIAGAGVGHWFRAPSAQNATDSTGRPAPRVAAKSTRIEQFAALRREHPDWTYEQFADALGVNERTVKRYAKELDGVQP